MNTNSRIAIFPGSFDPFTIGHYAILERALPLFDKIIIEIGVNSTKQDFFSLEKRINHISSIFADNIPIFSSKILMLTRIENYILKEKQFF